MEIIELQTYTKPQFEELYQLVAQLSEGIKLTNTTLNQVIENKNAHLYCIIENEHIIGCATLCVFYSPSAKKASIEDVVVSSEYRGQHLGRKLMTYVLDEAKKMGTMELHLTSKPKRVAANALYQALGFKKKETNYYQMKIE